MEFGEVHPHVLINADPIQYVYVHCEFLVIWMVTNDVIGIADGAAVDRISFSNLSFHLLDESFSIEDQADTCMSATVVLPHGGFTETSRVDIEGLVIR